MRWLIVVAMLGCGGEEDQPPEGQMNTGPLCHYVDRIEDCGAKTCCEVPSCFEDFGSPDCQGIVIEACSYRYSCGVCGSISANGTCVRDDEYEAPCLGSAEICMEVKTAIENDI